MDCPASHAIPDFPDRLSNYQQLFLRLYPPPQVFAVVSWGCAATSWLANVLNRHPDIYCVHAANYFWHILGNCNRLDGVSYLRIIGSQGHAHKAAGCVHGLSRHLVPECQRSFGSKFNAAVVVRDPIPRLHSLLAIFEQSEGVQAWDLEYVGDLISRSGVKLPADDYPSRFVVHAANMLNAILEEREVGKLYRCEDLTGNAETLVGFVEHITCGEVSSNCEWLQCAVEMKRLNAHTRTDSRDRLEDWQMDVIRKVVQPHAWELYEELGYQRPEFVA